MEAKLLIFFIVPCNTLIMTTCLSSDLETQYDTEREDLRAQLERHINGRDMDIDKLLADDCLDSKLLQFVVLNDGSPRGLADFAYHGNDGAVLIDRMLNDTSLMKEMLLADGPSALPKGPAQYGSALRIYTEIIGNTDHATWGGSNIFSRLALAIALEHAVPIQRNNPKSAGSDQEIIIDPVKRYLSYELAYINGELDPDFDTLTTWELRFVVDGNEPDYIAVWGRTMLRNYRPDHVFQRRYARMVNSNIRYGSQDVKHDKDDLQQYQNILMNGGVCGRRAFFGRFILRAFGIPTTARPSPGHGALVHWTPQGWVVALGGNWGAGWTKTVYHHDMDFLQTTKARRIEEAYWAVKKAQLIGDVMREKRVYGEHDKLNRELGYWNNQSLTIQRGIIEAFPHADLRRNCGIDRQLTIIERVLMSSPSSDSDVTYSNDSKLINVPASIFHNRKQAKGVQVMQSFQSGQQIYLPAFSSQGQTLMRGGTWKNDHNGCCSGVRIKSAGYGKYEDWGFRVAISGNSESCPLKDVTINLKNETGSVKMEFIYIKPGHFQMGGESELDGRFQCVEVPKHLVQITSGFYLGKYPVTQAQYEAVMGNNPSKSTKAPACPVDNIGEHDALDFCEKLVDTIGRDFRLPTEAEWEYACRANQGDKKWFFGDDHSKLREYAWFKENSMGKSHAVGQLKPNPFGLYDMYGNVYERVSDKYKKDYYAKSPLADPTGPSEGITSVLEYKVETKHRGRYELVAEVVTANYYQQLKISANGNDSSDAVMVLPFTNGYWQRSPPVILHLEEGRNIIRFWREKPPQHGVSIRVFILEFVPEDDCNK